LPEGLTWFPPAASAAENIFSSACPVEFCEADLSLTGLNRVNLCVSVAIKNVLKKEILASLAGWIQFRNFQL
jgi:hypothetical protein